MDGRIGRAIRGVTMVSFLLGAIAFVYVIGFEELDPRRNPRAAAIGAGPNIATAVVSIRSKIATGQLESAARQGVDLVEQAPESPQARLYTALTLRALGRHDEALAHFEALVSMTEGVEDQERVRENGLYLRGWGLLGVGAEARALEVFQRLARLNESRIGVSPGSNPYNLTCYWALAGDTEKALGYWEQALERRVLAEPGYWRWDPDMESLREDARFWEMAERYGLERDEGVANGDWTDPELFVPMDSVRGSGDEIGADGGTGGEGVGAGRSGSEGP